jgi:DNA-binding LacI/PurR family transcriptional regulator
MILVFVKSFLPHLTTIKVYKKELGQVAVQELITLMQNPGRVKTKTTTMNELVIRNSVAAPRKGPLPPVQPDVTK